MRPVGRMTRTMTGIENRLVQEAIFAAKAVVCVPIGKDKRQM